MELDTDKIDEVVLGLLYLTLHDQSRAWKEMDWDALKRLHGKGFIGDPVNKTKSVSLTDTGLREAKRLFEKQFSKRPHSTTVASGGLRNEEIRTANGVSGILCKSTVDGKYFFRVYETDGAFTDYHLRHDDLEVTISADAMASFYHIGEDNILDHSPEVLGIQPDKKP